MVGKKQRHCDPTDPDDDHKGDYWDHVGFDPEHRLVLGVVPGARSIENAEEIVAEVRHRVDPQVPLLLTSDEYPAYETAIKRTFGEPVVAPKGPGRPRIVPELQVAETVVYATVHKEQQGQRVVSVTQRQIFGTTQALATALERSEVSTGSTRRSSSDRTERTEAAMPVRSASPLGSARTGGCMRR